MIAAHLRYKDLIKLFLNFFQKLLGREHKNAYL
jgi:hypothetical protein